MKFLMNGFLIVAVMAAASLAISAQVKKITAKEYRDARKAADTATWNAYPRVEVYTYRSDEPRDVWFRQVYESKDRNYREIKITRSSGTTHEEEVDYDGQSFVRSYQGIWKRPEPPAVGIGGGRAKAVTSYTLEEFTQYGKSYKLYTETNTFPDGKKYVCWFRTDEAGRIQEYDDKEDGYRHMMIEYPKTVTPIKKPKLGSKDDVKAASSQ